MGSVAEIIVLHRNPLRAWLAARAAVAELGRVEKLMTRFTKVSDVGRVNHAGSGEPVAVSSFTAEVVREAIAWAEWSNGRFDPCIGKAVQLWDIGQRLIPPSARRVLHLAGRQFYRAVDVDTWNGQPIVLRRDSEVQIDLGGLAKGFAIDRAVRIVRGLGIQHGLVCVGGDLYALGASENGDPWRIGIRSPHNPSRLIGYVEASNRAVASSGDYFQYFEYRGRRYHHILNPATAEPLETAAHGITVTADSCMVADAAATTVYGLDWREAELVLSGRPGSPRVVGYGAKE
jgi:thiamine biosynthesis lipoprotein